LLPRASALEAEVDGDNVLLRPRFTAGEAELSWADAVKVLDQGFVKSGGAILQAPDLHLFTSVGFKLPQRKVAHGLVGDRLAFIRLTADSGLPVVAGDQRLRELARLLQGGAVSAVGEIPGLRSKLRPYQQDGVAWLWSRYLAGVGACWPTTWAR
jgi:hypothetical protein